MVPVEEKCVEDVRIETVIKCPCGSDKLHMLGYLTSEALCARCGRKIAIVEMHYRRDANMGFPVAFVGFVD